VRKVSHDRDFNDLDHLEIKDKDALKDKLSNGIKLDNDKNLMCEDEVLQ
jgi:hypothetical protein